MLRIRESTQAIGRYTPRASCWPGDSHPRPEAATLTRAPPVQRAATPVTVRFSNATGLAAIADDDPNASPRGMSIRFHLADHVHTDIVAHSADGFPSRTADEFWSCCAPSRQLHLTRGVRRRSRYFWAHIRRRSPMFQALMLMKAMNTVAPTMTG